MLYTKKEYAVLCGFDTNYLSVYVKRGKIILSGDYVDSSILQNRDFLKKREGKSIAPTEVKAAVTKEKKIKEPVEKKEKVLEIKPPVFFQPKAPNVKPPEINESNYGLDRQLKLQEFEKKKLETRLLAIKEQKLIGELIPTDLAKVIFVQHSQSIVTEFKNSIEDILTMFSKRKGLNSNEIAEIRGSIVGVVNNSVDKAINLSMKNINNIVSEFSIKREVGQHD